MAPPEKVIKILKPVNDVCFKKIFCKHDILIAFINAVTRRPQDDQVTELTYMSTELHSPDVQVKKLFPDLLCKSKKGDRFLVEVQMYSHQAFKERVQVYASRIMSNQLKPGADWKDIKPVTTIVITCFDALGNRKPYSHHHTSDSESNDCCLNLVQYVFLQLSCFDRKVRTIEEIAELELHDLWLYFFVRGSFGNNMLTEEEIIAMKNRSISLFNAIQLLDEARWSDEQKRQFEEVEDANMLYQSGIESAVATAVENERRANVKRMLENRIPRNVIMEVSGWSEDKINSYANELSAPDS